MIENNKLQKLLKQIEEEGELSEILENEILYAYGARGKKAINVLKKQHLKKLIIDEILIIWEVEGSTDSYFVFDSYYCECRDFYIRVLNRKKNEPCYHLLAKIIGERLNLFKQLKLSNADYRTLLSKKYKKI